jgi:hypothetical protein
MCRHTEANCKYRAWIWAQPTIKFKRLYSQTQKKKLPTKIKISLHIRICALYEPFHTISINKIFIYLVFN